MTIQITADYLRIVGLTQVFMAIEIICNGVFVGLGMPKIPATISIIFTTASHSNGMVIYTVVWSQWNLDKY